MSVGQRRALREGLGGRLGDPEVEDLDERHSVRTTREKEIRRLQVAMDDSERVSLGDALARLEQVFDRFSDRQRPALGEHLAEIAPLEELHHDEGRALRRLPDVGDSRDVLALDPHRRARLTKKPGDGLRVTGRLREQELDRVRFLELEVGNGEDDAHPSDADDAIDPVLVRDDLSDPRDAGAALALAGADGVVGLVRVGHGGTRILHLGRRPRTAMVGAAPERRVE